MSAQQQFKFWLTAVVIFIALIWALSPMLLPFASGLAIAYFLNPVVNVLTRTGLSRITGAAVVLLGFIVLAVGVVLVVLPLLQSQIALLIEVAPSYADRLHQNFTAWSADVLNRLSPEDVGKLRSAAEAHIGDLVNWIAKFLQHVLSRGFAILDILALIFITPLVAFYVLRDWQDMTAVIDRALPRRYRDIIRAQLRAIDQTLAGFVRGQALVCMTLAAYYALSLSLVGLNFAASVGLTTGLLSFIPYVGAAFGWITSLLLGSVQFGDWEHALMIMAVFGIGQVLEGYFLTPRLVGNRVGLHPVWIVFGLFAGGSLLGFLGVLIAVPVTAVVGVLLRFGMQQYRASRYYQDGTAAADSGA